MEMHIDLTNLEIGSATVVPVYKCGWLVYLNEQGAATFVDQRPERPAPSPAAGSLTPDGIAQLSSILARGSDPRSDEAAFNPDHQFDVVLKDGGQHTLYVQSFRTREGEVCPKVKLDDVVLDLDPLDASKLYQVIYQGYASLSPAERFYLDRGSRDVFLDTLESVS